MERILLVEDDRSIVRSLREFLTSEGFAVEAVDGQRAATERLAVPIDVRGQRLVCEIGAETLCGDLAWTTEAVGNILKNCMEHTPEGGTITARPRRS